MLSHADPQQVDTVIKPFLTQPGANSVAIKDPSVLIVPDYAANIVRVGKLVQLLDKPKPSVIVEFFTVKNMEAGALGQQLSSLLTARGKATGTASGSNAGPEIASDARTNQLLLVGRREQMDDVLNLAKSLDPFTHPGGRQCPLESSWSAAIHRRFPPSRSDLSSRGLEIGN